MSMEHAVVYLLEGLCHKAGGNWFGSWWCWNYQIASFFQPHYVPGIDLASNRNEYRESFLGGGAQERNDGNLISISVPIV
jgi:hypothetical protein